MENKEFTWAKIAQRIVKANASTAKKDDFKSLAEKLPQMFFQTNILSAFMNMTIKKDDVMQLAFVQNVFKPCYKALHSETPDLPNSINEYLEIIPNWDFDTYYYILEECLIFSGQIKEYAKVLIP